MQVLQPTSLYREPAEKSAPIDAVTTSQTVELQRLAGGWAKVQTGRLNGWVHSSRLALATHTPPAATRAAPPLQAPRSPGPQMRSTRHALIVGIGRYRSDPSRPVAALAGVRHDLASALEMAQQMEVPLENITLLRDADATHEGVRQALRELETRVRAGDRVFLYWSGHGSRNVDSRLGCIETLVPHDLRDISNHQFAQWLAPLARKVEKMLVVYDACHSGGIGAAADAAARSSGGIWTAKFTPPAAACEQPSNQRSRGLTAVAGALGIDGQDLVHLASSRHDELSFDNAESGGLATSSLLACMRGAARDLDGSGAISVDELAACAQPRIDQALRTQTQFDPPHLVITGNRAFVPAWFAATPAAMPSIAPGPDPAPPPAAAPATASSEPAAPTPPLTVVLEHIHAQRDSKRRIEVRTVSDRLRIGADALDFSVTSSHDGYVYVALLGTDQQSLHLLFPNELDSRNRITAGESMLLPRKAWRIVAAGPPGEDTLLVMVTDGPRDLASLGGGSSGPFARPLTDAQGRARLQWLLGRAAQGSTAGCPDPGCSDAFGSALFKLKEH